MKINMEKTIYANQILHGYANGHQLLASSCDLSLDDRKKVDELSDLSGQYGVKKIVDYYTGYPIENGEKYIISKTWYAHEMVRPGCVWTHSLVFRTEELCRISDFSMFLNSFRRPTELDYGAYTFQIPLPAEDEKRFPSHNIQRLQYEIFTVYASAPPTYVLVDPPALQFENEFFMVLCSLPQEILQNFTFCTMSYNNRKYRDTTFQYQMIPKDSRLDLARCHERTPVCEEFGAIERYPYWIEHYASALLENKLNFLYTFIRQYGDNCVTLENFSRFSRLYFGLTGKMKLSLIEYADSVEALFPGDCSILQKTAELILDDTFFPNTFKGHDYMILEIMEMKRLFLEKPHEKKLSKIIVSKTPEKLRPYLERYIASVLPTHLRDIVEDMIQELPPAALREASGMDRRICFVLIRKNPNLLLCPDIWSQPKNFQQEMLGAVNQDLSPAQMKKLLTIILQVDSESIATDLYRFWGENLLPALYSALHTSAPPNKKQLDDWTSVLLKNQHLLLKEILNLPNAEWRRELFLKLDIYAAGLTQSVGVCLWQQLYHEFFSIKLPTKEQIGIAIQFLPVVFCTDYRFEDNFIRDIIGTVYREAKADTLSYDAWNRFQHILPQVEDCQAWDRCLRIRKALEEKGYSVSLIEY